MFESLQLLGVLLFAFVAIIGLVVGIVFAICTRRNPRYRRRAITVLVGIGFLAIFVTWMGWFTFREFYLNENLVFACRRGDLAEAKWLLSLWASPNAEGIKGMDDALGAASEGGHRELVELLLSKGAKVGHEDFHGKTAIQRAKDAGHFDIVKLLEESENQQ